MSSARWSEQQLADYLARREVEQLATGEHGSRGFWPVTPVAAPRQVRSDKWAPSPAVRRYRQFRDDVARAGVWHPNPGDLVVFLMPIPTSWSKRKREDRRGYPHEVKPDTDNLVKALLDACYGDDASIWAICAAKVWSDTPGIFIERRAPVIRIPFVEHVEVTG